MRSGTRFAVHVLVRVPSVYTLSRGGCRILVWQGHWQGVWGRKSPAGFEGTASVGVWSGAKPPTNLKKMLGHEAEKST